MENSISNHIQLSCWLKNIADHFLITDLCIPGSHDAMTATCDDPYYQTQTLSLLEQLNIGVRFFDLRLTRSLVAAHREWISTITAEYIFKQLTYFIEKKPSEFIIIRIQNANEKKDDFELYKSVLQPFIEKYFNVIHFPDGNSENNFKKNYWPTVGDVRGRIIVLECSPPEFNIAINANQRWAFNWQENNNIQLQDNWNGPDINEKTTCVKTLLYQTTELKKENKLVLNHVSATNGKLGNPVNYSKILNEIIRNELSEIKNSMDALYSGRGILIYDFVDQDLCYKTVILNRLVG